MNVLPQFKGLLMHDAWSVYFKLSAKHALCGAHLLCKLRGLAEPHAQVWASELRDALRLVCHQQQNGAITPEVVRAFEHRFGALLDTTLMANPPAPPIPGRRGRTKRPSPCWGSILAKRQTPGRNLALRCQQHREAVLHFLHDEGVPFDNNHAERDIRPWCIKRKVSGGFRSEEGGQHFARILSDISTLQTQGLNVWHGLVSVFRGDVIMPCFCR
jgi:transposase